MNSILVYSERPNFRRFGRPWNGAELVEIREFEGDRPDPSEGHQFVISPDEFAYLRDYAGRGPLKYREPTFADRELGAGRSEVESLRSERDQIAADCDQLRADRAALLHEAETAAVELERLVREIADRRTDLERLSASGSETAPAPRQRRRRKKDDAETENAESGE